MFKPVKSKNPYKPKNGSLEFCKNSADFLESHDGMPENQVLPFFMLDPNPWRALTKAGISSAPMVLDTYTCPYTDYEYTHYSVIPVAICSEDLKVYKELKKYPNYEIYIDHAFTRHMNGTRMFQLTKIQEILLGSGYSSDRTMCDGGRTIKSAKISLDNGDFLWVYYIEWHNK